LNIGQWCLIFLGKFAIGHAKCCLFTGGHPLSSLLLGDTLVSENLASGHRSPVSANFRERKFRFGHRVPLRQTWVDLGPSPTGLVGPAYNALDPSVRVYLRHFPSPATDAHAHVTPLLATAPSSPLPVANGVEHRECMRHLVKNF
jgi:hypothetical protein